MSRDEFKNFIKRQRPDLASDVDSGELKIKDVRIGRMWITIVRDKNKVAVLVGGERTS